MDDPVKSTPLCAVPVGGLWLLHAPLHGTTAICDPHVLEALATGLPPRVVGGKLGRLFDALGQPPARPAPERCGAPRPDFLGLVPTRACNMACRYCGFASEGPACPAMTEALAREAVEWMGQSARAQGSSQLAVDFFGGEPMVAGHVVRAAVDAAKRLAPRLGLQPRFELATNGCFGQPDQAFVQREFHHVMLSLDGPREVHDAHRLLRSGDGSFATVASTAAALAGGPSLCIRMCVTRTTAPRLPADVEWVCRTFRPASVHVEPLRPTAASDEAGLVPPDPWTLAQSMHAASRVAAACGVQFVCASAQVRRILTAFCPVAKDVPILDPEGIISACYMLAEDWIESGLDLRLGRWSAQAAPAWDDTALARVRALARTPEACLNCFCRWHCAGGCLVQMHGSSRKDGGDAFCIRTRLLCALALLDSMGRTDLADGLAADRAAMERLALRRSDHLAEALEAQP